MSSRLVTPTSYFGKGFRFAQLVIAKSKGGS